MKWDGTAGSVCWPAPRYVRQRSTAQTQRAPVARCHLCARVQEIYIYIYAFKSLVRPLNTLPASHTGTFLGIKLISERLQLQNKLKKIKALLSKQHFRGVGQRTFSPLTTIYKRVEGNTRNFLQIEWTPINRNLNTDSEQVPRRKDWHQHTFYNRRGIAGLIAGKEDVRAGVQHKGVVRCEGKAACEPPCGSVTAYGGGWVRRQVVGRGWGRSI